MSAPTTTSPSHSVCESWPRACVRCCDGDAPRRPTARADRGAGLSWQASRRRLRRRRHQRRWRVDTAHAPRIRAAAVSRREQEPRAVTRPAARTGLGLRPLRGDQIGGRARRAAARKTPRSRTADRDGCGVGISVRRVTQDSFHPALASVAASRANVIRARSTRCQSV